MAEKYPSGAYFEGLGYGFLRQWVEDEAPVGT
jgi:hypothetical protein